MMCRPGRRPHVCVHACLCVRACVRVRGPVCMRARVPVSLCVAGFSCAPRVYVRTNAFVQAATLARGRTQQQRRHARQSPGRSAVAARAEGWALARLDRAERLLPRHACPLIAPHVPLCATCTGPAGGGFRDTAAARDFLKPAKKFRTRGFLATSYQNVRRAGVYQSST
jgi:hypothetical protein